MTGLTLISRLTGLVRVLVVAAVLGTTFLGNTFQSANSVSNLIFELFAAGALQAAMIPTLVALFDGGDDEEGTYVAGALLGLAASALAALAAAGMLAAPWIMRLLVAGVESADVQAAQVRLGTALLWFFLPQVVLYAAGAVATAVLNARGHFALPVAAPIANNVVVIAACWLFWELRGGAAPSLDLSTVQVVVLGLGTTLGVLALSAIPWLALRRQGVALRPRLDLRHPRVRQVVRGGGWATLFLACTQILTGVVLVLANGVEGGVVVYQVAYTLFLVPHALFAVPVLTALFPSLSRHAAAGDAGAYARGVGAGVAAIAFLALPAVAALVALAQPLARLVLFGESSGGAGGALPAVVAAFAPGLVGYGLFLFLARGLYAAGDMRGAAVVHLGLVVLAAAAMIVGSLVVAGPARVTLLAGAHSVAYLAGAAALAYRLRARWWVRGTGPVRSLAMGTLAATAAGAAMWAVQLPVPEAGRLATAGLVAGAGALGGAVYLGTQAALGGTRFSAVMSLLRGSGG
ncbi:MAG TPA: lipid II flippase MurJ [Acidimicrobiales bacterium]|nr:lipid II flippase MurJ [Acidimicrobiales bacterium]